MRPKTVTSTDHVQSPEVRGGRLRLSLVGVVAVLAALTAIPLVARHSAPKQTRAVVPTTAGKIPATSIPVMVCGNSRWLTSPYVLAPRGAVRVPAGDDSVRTMSSGGQINLNYDIHARTVYWFAPGLHTLGTGQFNQIQPANGDTFVGAPGAVLSGGGSNDSAFAGTATGVKIEYLTIEDFVPPNGQYAVNHDQAGSWTIMFNTIEDNTQPGAPSSAPGGAALGTGNNNLVEHNCLAHNGEYGLNAGGNDVTIRFNEISWNGRADFPDNDCGCSGGAKFWDMTNVTVTDNYVHDNYNVGLWADTDNAGFDISGNYISGNWAEGIIYEISYNAAIMDNTLRNNGWGIGSSAAGGIPYGAAIYVNGSGGDPNVASNYRGTLSISGNVLINNWDGVVVYQNADRTCGSGSNSSTGYCTRGNKSFTAASCAANYRNSSARTSPPTTSTVVSGKHRILLSKATALISTQRRSSTPPTSCQTSPMPTVTQAATTSTPAIHPRPATITGAGSTVCLAIQDQRAP